MNCSSCAEPIVAGAAFCEACGADLTVTPPAAPCVECGGAVDGEYCLTCGHRQPTGRDHVEAVDGRVAGVTDRGQRHHRNEDAMAIADMGPAIAAVVCDGVSSTDNPDVASQAAADAFLAVIRQSWTDGTYRSTETLATAVMASQQAVLGVERPGLVGNPSCTLAAAVVVPDADGCLVDVCWLGDSRVYWLGDPAPEVLTEDHSWAYEMAATGAMSLDDAMRDPRAHTITRWLGADAHDLTPATATFRRQTGRVLVCSDGLWNYAADPEALADRPELDGLSALEAAVGLTAFANDAGGHDNITVLIVDPAAHVDTGATA